MGWQSYTADGERKVSSSVGTLGWEIVDKKTISGAGEVIFTDLDKYEAIELVSVDLNTVDEGEFLLCQVSIDNGATFLSTGIYTYQRIGSQVTDSGIATGGALSGTSLQFDAPSRAMASDTGFGHAHTLRVFNLANAGSRTPMFQSHFDYKTSNGGGGSEQTWCRTTGGINGTLAGPMNGIRIYSEVSGGLRGTYILLGLPKVVKIQDQIVLPPNGWQTIETIAAAGASSVEFTDIDQFDAIEILANDLQVSNDNSTPQCVVSDDGGSSYIAANYQLNRWSGLSNSQTFSSAGATGAANWQLGGSFGGNGFHNGAAYGHAIDLFLYGIQSSATVRAHAKWETMYSANSGAGLSATAQGKGMLQETGSMLNAIRIQLDAGTFTAGKFTLLGLVQ